MLKILIVEPSYLIRKGMIGILDQFPEITRIEVIGTHHGLNDMVEHFLPDVIILNTSIAAMMNERDFKEKFPSSCKIIHLINTAIPSNSPQNQISVMDSKVVIIEKLTPFIKPTSNNSENDNSEELTPREKLILENVALGLTNKEIASKLFISTHTVISHRKNITRKLHIKSVSGLTVYAIINGIVKMEDVS